MDIKLTITTIWHVHPIDTNLAKALLEEKPRDIVSDFIDDAFHGDKEYDSPIVLVEEVK